MCVAFICYYYYLNNNIIVIERFFIPARTIDTSYPFRALPRWSCSCSGQTFRVADPIPSTYILPIYTTSYLCISDSEFDPRHIRVN